MTTIRVYQFFEGLDISGTAYNFITTVEGVVKTIKETIGTWTQRSQGRAELATLNDHLLEDIGLTRMEVNYEVGKYFWQK